MRIIGGEYKGRRLKTPEDQRVRPTSDKVRQAIFNILMHHDFGDFSLEGVHALDGFAGTGALGLEALSHGADYCLFIDVSADSRALVRENVESLQLTGVSKIWRRDATKPGPMGPGAKGPFSLIFLDPPYRKELIGPAIKGLTEGGWLSPDAVLVVETAADEPAIVAEGFVEEDTRTYGDTRVQFLQAGQAEPGA